MTSFLQLKTHHMLIVSITILYTISTYITYLFSSNLSDFYGFENLNTFFNKQIMSLFIGISIIFVLSFLNKDKWFNRLGASLFFGSLALLILMLFVPISLVSSINGEKTFLTLGGIVSINPMLYFTIGSIWLISWIHEKKEDIKYTNITLIALIFLTALFFVNFNNVAMFLMLEVVFVSIAFYLNGMNKFTFFGVLVGFILSIIYIFSASYRLHRIKAWFNSSSDFLLSSSVRDTLHENILLSLINSIGVFSLFIIITLFLFITYLTMSHIYSKKSYKLFAIGISFLLLADLLFNLLYIFGLSPLYPPSMYLFGFGSSIVVASFIILGMLMMIIKDNQEINKSKKSKVTLFAIVGLALLITSNSTRYEKKVELKPVERAKIITDDNITIAYSEEIYKLIFLHDKLSKAQFFSLMEKISTVVPIKKEKIERLYFSKRNKQFAYKIISYNVTKKQSLEVVTVIEKFNLENSLNDKRKYYAFELSGERRVYPYKNSFTPVLGYTYKREYAGFTYTVGRMGIENFYDTNLSSLNMNHENIYLSIDFDLQQRLEKELSLQKQELNADEVTSIVIDPITYNIKAFASSNRYHPKKIRREDYSSLNISAVEKLFNISHYLESINKAIKNEKGLSLQDGYKKFGFYQKSGVDLKYEKISQDTLELNLVQFLKMYTVFYAEGKMAIPSIAKLNTPKVFEQIITKENALVIQSELEKFLQQMKDNVLTISDDNTTAYVTIKPLEVRTQKYLQAMLIINPKDDNSSTKIIVVPKEERIVNLYAGIVVEMTEDTVVIRNKHDNNIVEYRNFTHINPSIKKGIFVNKGLVLGRNYGK